VLASRQKNTAKVAWTKYGSFRCLWWCSDNLTTALSPVVVYMCLSFVVAGSMIRTPIHSSTPCMSYTNRGCCSKCLYLVRLTRMSLVRFHH